MDKNSWNGAEKSKYPERSSALHPELVKTAGYKDQISKKIKKYRKKQEKTGKIKSEKEKLVKRSQIKSNIAKNKSIEKNRENGLAKKSVHIAVYPMRYGRFFV